MNSPVVYVILGPTATGKTDLLLQLAKTTNIEVINCDSRQIYQDMPIGTTQPSVEIRKAVTHHLIDFLSPDQQFSAGQFKQHANKLILEIISRGNLPVVCGGTGFYYRSLSTEMIELPDNDSLKQEISQMTHIERVELLKKKDPLSVVQPGESSKAGRIHPNDQYRIERALLVLMQTGRPLRSYYEAGFNVRKDLKFIGFWLDIEIEEWRSLVVKRARQMIDSGMVDEAVRIRQQFGICPGLNTVGYFEALQCADLEISQQKFEEKLIQSHLQYGRHQRLWFRKQSHLPLYSKEEALDNFQKDLNSVIQS
ncbi:MAG: tRNA (adenosine(37)-N6)-dimethylallyltransferase MiaA [Leptonema sp. (in: Bacteria)]|nr:tRNA (adenosine(37)-N6)-dimethylallyltransferase MiaA [Leptonema sp. (in: bacteria)]